MEGCTYPAHLRRHIPQSADTDVAGEEDQAGKMVGEPTLEGRSGRSAPDGTRLWGSRRRHRNGARQFREHRGTTNSVGDI